MPQSSAELLIKTLDEMKSQRSTFENEWREIQQLVRYNRRDRKNISFDDTAANACEELASGLHSYLTNPTERWFELHPDGMDYSSLDQASMLWLEMCSEIIYSHYQREDSRLNPSLHETYLDLTSYGTCSIHQEWNIDRGTLLFKAIPLFSCWFKENNEAIVDTVFREICWTKRQILQEFNRSGDVIPKKIMDDKDNDKVWTIIHAIFPRNDRDIFKLDKLNKPFASVWVCVEAKAIIRESGYDDFPTHVSRWVKSAEDVYGTSPAMKCLPSIRMVNQIDRILIKAGQKIIDPPLQVPNDGFMLPITTSPGALIFKEPGSDDIVPLETKGQIPVGMEQAEQKREAIRLAFCAEWLRMQKDNKEMTAYEVQDRRNEKLRFMAPMLGRQQAELLSPLVARSFNLLWQFNRLPKPPRGIQGKKLKVHYISQSARAQLGVKAIAMGQYVQDLIPLAQISPEVFDAIDMDKLAQQLALARGTSRSILRSPEEIAAIRQQRSQQQQAQQLIAAAEPASKAIANIAKAQQAGL